MATCIYPGCGGDLRKFDGAGYCVRCLEPVRVCGSCSGWNRGLAPHCRLCSQPLGSYPADCLALGQLDGWDRAKRHDVTINENLWATPRAYGGYLWFLTAGGQLCRYSPFQGRYSEQHTFGPGVGYSTLLIGEIAPAGSNGRPPRPEPFAITLNASNLIAFGMLSRTPIELPPPDGERFLADAVQEFQGMDSAGGAVWCLSANQSGSISLVKADIAERRREKWDLGLKAAAGPVLVDSYTLAWGRDEFAVFDGEHVRKQPFPSGFSAALSAGGAACPRTGLGRRPAVVHDQDVYLPGSFGGKPAFANICVRAGVMPIATLRLQDAAAYAQDSESRLIVAAEGRLDQYQQANPNTVWADPQLRPDRPPFSGAGLHAGFVQSAAGELLRFRLRRSFDTNLPPGKNILDSHGFCTAGPALLCTYTSSDGEAAITSWHA